MTAPLAVFIGPMGAGKTRIGKRVARALEVPFTDTDKVIVAAHGPIADIFDQHGEPHFRALERDVVHEALTGGGVVSLGGGAVLDPGTQQTLEGLPVAPARSRWHRGLAAHLRRAPLDLRASRIRDLRHLAPAA